MPGDATNQQRRWCATGEIPVRLIASQEKLSPRSHDRRPTTRLDPAAFAIWWQVHLGIEVHKSRGPAGVCAASWSEGCEKKSMPDAGRDEPSCSRPKKDQEPVKNHGWKRPSVNYLQLTIYVAIPERAWEMGRGTQQRSGELKRRVGRRANQRLSKEVPLIYRDSED